MEELKICPKSGNILEEFSCIKFGLATTNLKSTSSISACLKGIAPTAGGFIWKYKNN